MAAVVCRHPRRVSVADEVVGPAGHDLGAVGERPRPRKRASAHPPPHSSQLRGLTPCGARDKDRVARGIEVTSVAEEEERQLQLTLEVPVGPIGSHGSHDRNGQVLGEQLAECSHGRPGGGVHCKLGQVLLAKH